MSAVHTQSKFAITCLTLQSISIILKGYISFSRTGTTPSHAYNHMRKLYCLTNGYFNDIFSVFLAFFWSKYNLKIEAGILGNLNQKDINNIISGINTSGFFIFDRKISSKECEELINFSLQNFSVLTPPLPKANKAIYDRQNKHAIRYDFDENDLLENHIIQGIASDLSLLAIAQSYFNCKPILDLVTMWWSTPFIAEATSEAAQLYHFDMDRIKFLKFFVYLTDVTHENGPHCYIKGSHKRKPKDLLRDERIQDEELEKYYSNDQFIEITGGQGTILAVDTRGFHKGKPLTSGDRLILQIEFSNCLFGANYNLIHLKGEVSQKFLSVMKSCKRTYTRFKK